MGTLTTVFLLSTLCVALSWSMNDEKRLTKHLIENYRRMGKEGRPVLNSDDTLELKFGLSLIQILDVSYRTQTMEMAGWYKMEWIDDFLKWDPSQFGGIKSVRIPPKDIFQPDVAVYNSASKPEDLTDTPLTLVQHDGHVLYVPPVKQRFLCSVPRYIKGKTQDFTCSMRHGSWTYDSSMINMTMSAPDIDTKFYSPHPMWELVSTKAERHETKYDCCPESYVDITYDVTLKMAV